jgi:hypothetical protein
MDETTTDSLTEDRTRATFAFSPVETHPVTAALSAATRSNIRKPLTRASRAEYPQAAGRESRARRSAPSSLGGERSEPVVRRQNNIGGLLG